MVKYGNNNYTSLTNLIRKNQDDFKKILGEYTIEPYYSIEQYAECIKWFCNYILEFYQPEKIILHKYYMTDSYISKNGTVKKFSNIEHINQMNKIFKEIYSIAENILKGCFLIEMPDYVLGDEKHIWGTHPLHYAREYYDYAYDALKYIIYHNAAVPESLYLKHNNLLMIRYYKAQQKTILIEKNKLASDNVRLTCYAKTFVALFKNYSKTLDNITLFCKQHNLKSVAFWGDYIISEILADLLKKCNIHIDYIICNWNHNTADKVIPVSANTYPYTDGIIVCDVVSIQQKIDYLKCKVDYPIFSINDFIPLIF